MKHYIQTGYATHRLHCVSKCMCLSQVSAVASTLPWYGGGIDINQRQIQNHDNVQLALTTFINQLTYNAHVQKGHGCGIEQ